MLVNDMICVPLFLRIDLLLGNSTLLASEEIVANNGSLFHLRKRRICRRHI
jgi:hypothetical protein